MSQAALTTLVILRHQWLSSIRFAGIFPATVPFYDTVAVPIQEYSEKCLLGLSHSGSLFNVFTFKQVIIVNCCRKHITS